MPVESYFFCQYYQTKTWKWNQRGPFLEKELLIEIVAKFAFSKRNKDYLCIIECCYNYYNTAFLQAGRNFQNIKVWYYDGGSLVLQLKAMANINRTSPTSATYSHDSKFMKVHCLISASGRALLMWTAASHRLAQEQNTGLRLGPKSVVQLCWNYLQEMIICSSSHSFVHQLSIARQYISRGCTNVFVQLRDTLVMFNLDVQYSQGRINAKRNINTLIGVASLFVASKNYGCVNTAGYPHFLADGRLLTS